MSKAGLKYSFKSSAEEEEFNPFEYASKIKIIEGVSDSSIVNKILRDLDGKRGRFFTEKEVEYFQGSLFIGAVRSTVQQLVRTVEAIKNDPEYLKLSDELKLEYAIQKMNDGDIKTGIGGDFGTSIKKKFDDIVKFAYTNYFTNTREDVAIDLIRTIINRLITNKTYSVEIPKDILTSVMITYLVPSV